ncbi:DM13 domain-containing protein [Pseudarthrobacter sp. B4EP4b]|uniref:DM13 domain-containing protein n=1 Tax=Pseudarthrobacter sp. B4EP4b TaxID=2590664 RepID=UPI0021068348|nr:DM13 domain-containing protein [Pseudarthrobacter sp. B4EP4b]
MSATMQGTFQSLADATTGTATLEVNESGAVLQLEDMSTGPGKDLRVMLSPGTLAARAGGELEVSSTKMIEIGPFRAGATQRFVMDSQMWTAMEEPVRSVLIYDYSAKNTRGAAALSDQK